jgi:hypothetical protein
MCNITFSGFILLLLLLFAGCKKESTAEPKLNTTPVNSVAEAVTLGTKAYTLGYQYTVEPYFGFTREVPFESQSPSYHTIHITADPLSRYQSYTLLCMVQNDTVYAANYMNIKYDTYDRVNQFEVDYSFNATANRYAFDVSEITRDAQNRATEYMAEISADVNGKTVSGILTFP